VIAMLHQWHRAGPILAALLSTNPKQVKADYNCLVLCGMPRFASDCTNYSCSIGNGWHPSVIRSR